MKCHVCWSPSGWHNLQTTSSCSFSNFAITCSSDLWSPPLSPAVTPPSTQAAELFLIGPPLQDTQRQKDVPFVCLLIGFETSHFSITWKVNGNEMNLKREMTSRNGNGTETLQSTLNAQRSDWHKGSRITCQARHLCSDKPIERHLVKAQGGFLAWSHPLSSHSKRSIVNDHSFLFTNENTRCDERHCEGC